MSGGTDDFGEEVADLREALSSGMADQRPADRAYAGIRRAILLGTLKPGDHLAEEMLAAMTGTSRTPVREAIRRLAAEGLATTVNRHRFVPQFSYEEVVIVFDVRAQLEGYAASVAARKITTSELAGLSRLIDEIEELKGDGSTMALERFVSLNTDFHFAVVEGSHSMHLRQMMAPHLSLPLAIFKQFVVDRAVNITRSNEQHREILAALTERNSDWARLAMTGHILSTRPQPRDSHRKPKAP